jgi:hypothetical protein
MSEKKKFLLRLDPELYAALEKWAADDLRSVNAQMEFLLMEAVKRAGRLKGISRTDSSSPGEEA